MCGIFGTYRLPSLSVEDGLLRLRHRGPDGSGIMSSGDATHGHVRLALLDLTSASDQPFLCRDSLLAFNGEIWNYRELREVLRGLGHDFQTTGDTEVLAAALCEWGTEALPRLEGMFAFSASVNGRHFLARDRYGKIPLYLKRQGSGFAWSSERKGFASQSGVTPLPPGSLLDLSTGALRNWYRVPLLSSPFSPADLLSALRRSVRRRLNADAPLCCLISGGLDSALILSLAREVRPDLIAYTASLSPHSPDLLAARRLCASLSVELREVLIPPPTEARIRSAIRTIEIPSKAQIEIALLCLPLAERLQQDGFKAVLSGEAADELFGGYGNMCIQAARADDRGWREIRLAQLEKMGRGNFLRCNKVFMAHGVECRLPFMDREIVEPVLSLSKADCPPGKQLLKAAASGVVPDWVIRRKKETFQGGAGVDTACARLLSSPIRYYNAETRSLFGCLPAN